MFPTTGALHRVKSHAACACEALVVMEGPLEPSLAPHTWRCTRRRKKIRFAPRCAGLSAPCLIGVAAQRLFLLLSVLAEPGYHRYTGGAARLIHQNVHAIFLLTLESFL